FGWILHAGSGLGGGRAPPGRVSSRMERNDRDRCRPAPTQQDTPRARQLRYVNGRKRFLPSLCAFPSYPCATAPDQGEAASLMPMRVPSARCTITFGEAKLIGTAPCSTISSGPSAASASSTSGGRRRSALTASTLET